MRSVSRGLYVGVGTLAIVTFIGAQQSSTPAPAAPTAPTTPTPTTTGTGGGGGGIMTPSPSPTPTTSSTTPNLPTMPPRPIFVSGRVLLNDGGDLPERATIERLCAANNVRQEGYTDSKGYFAIQLGQGQMGMPDASNQFTFDPNSINRPGTLSANPDNQFWDCELRAKIAGFRSTSILLAGRRAMDNPDVGKIVLTPLNKIEGHATSLTNALAPKDAKKALEKGVNAAKKNKNEEAEKEFRKAVEIYPKYAEAWLELGKLFIERQQWAAARQALELALAADPRYVFPYEQLYTVAFQENNWQELADVTDRLLRLNPYDFVGAYYYNGVANYQLQHFDEAAKSLREAMGMDFRGQNPKTHYVLGLVLLQQRNYEEASEHLQTFLKQAALKLAADDPLIPKVKGILAQLDKVEKAEVVSPALP